MQVEDLKEEFFTRTRKGMKRNLKDNDTEKRREFLQRLEKYISQVLNKNTWVRI